MIAGLATWALWPDPPRQREYLDATGCLLTGEEGVATEPARSVWASMQEASVATLVRVQFLEVNGQQTAANAGPYLASLATSRCGTIIATGQAQVEAVSAAAAGYPAIDFVTVDGGTAAANVRVLHTTAPDALHADIRERLEDLARSAS